jgi:uncharacterized protein (DUF58 family)
MSGLVVFVLVLTAIAGVLRIDFFFTVVYFLIAIYGVSYLWKQWIRRGVSVKRTFVDHAYLGDRVEVSIEVTNAAWLPAPWLVLHESLPVQLAAPGGYRQAFSLRARARHAFEYSIYCRQRGYYRLGPLVLDTGDLFGLSQVGRIEVEPEPIVVYPKVLPLASLGLPTRSPQAILPARSPLFEDKTRLMGVRDYQRGDSPRRIHWSATASVGRLLVKRYQPAIARETMICLDLCRDSYGDRQRYAATELAIVVAASLAHHVALQDKLPVGLVTEAMDPLQARQTFFFLPPQRERVYLMQVLEVLARVQTAQDAPLGELLRRGSSELAWGSTVMLITGRETVELYENLVYLRRMGFAVSAILVQPPHRSEAVEGKAELADIPVHHVWRERDVELLS